MGFKNRFRVLSRFARERAKESFLISDVSVGNITLCQGPHVVCELGLRGPDRERIIFTGRNDSRSEHLK
jgi:hypothetical protein